MNVTTGDMKLCWDKFDFKCVLGYVGNKGRMGLLEKEFSRVGLEGYQILWNFDSVFVETLFANVRMKRNRKLPIFNNALGHYRMVKTAYQLGCRNALLMEDDIRFLKDIERLHAILEAIPEDYELAMLDTVKKGDERSGTAKVNDHWSVLDGATSAACYAIDRMAMRRIIQVYESTVTEADGHLYPSDTFFRKEIMGLPKPAAVTKMYYAPLNAARQVKIPDSATNTNYDRWQNFYEVRGCRRELYGD